MEKRTELYETEYLIDIGNDPSNSELYKKYKEFLRSWLERRKEDSKASWYKDRKAKFLFLEAQEDGDEKHMQRLAADINPVWLAVVSRPAIMNCGRENRTDIVSGEKWWKISSSGHREETYAEWKKNHPHFQFEFVCSKKWNEMTPTDNRKVRFCGDCQKNVYFCDTTTEARALGQQGCCVGLDVGVKRKEDDMIGECAIFGTPRAEDIEKEENRIKPDKVSLKRLISKFERNITGKNEPWLEE